MSGINTTIVVETPAMIGIAYSRRASIMALRGSYPILTLALAACTITMIVSTAIPNDKIREKFVKKFKLYPKEYNKIKVDRNARGSVRVAKSESMNQTNIYMVINTNIRVVIASWRSPA